MEVFEIRRLMDGNAQIDDHIHQDIFQIAVTCGIIDILRLHNLVRLHKHNLRGQTTVPQQKINALVDGQIVAIDDNAFVLQIGLVELHQFVIELDLIQPSIDCHIVLGQAAASSTSRLHRESELRVAQQQQLIVKDFAVALQSDILLLAVE